MSGLWSGHSPVLSHYLWVQRSFSLYLLLHYWCGVYGHQKEIQRASHFLLRRCWLVWRYPQCFSLRDSVTLCFFHFVVGKFSAYNDKPYLMSKGLLRLNSRRIAVAVWCLLGSATIVPACTFIEVPVNGNFSAAKTRRQGVAGGDNSSHSPGVTPHLLA